MGHSDADYKQLASLPLEAKIAHAQTRIREWYDYHNGQVYVSFSGGKASAVLRDLVLEMYPKTDVVFVDSSAEFPEIRAFAIPRSTVVLKPKRDFRRIIQEHGYPVVSKQVARALRYAQQGKQWAINKLDDKFASGDVRKVGHMSKWKYLIDAPFKISDICCYVTKHQPIHAYDVSTGQHAYVGLQASESKQRLDAWKAKGCNAYGVEGGTSNPLSIWTDADLWAYHEMRGMPHCELYDMGYERTGCAFCMFGVHREKCPNRFQLMAETHPKLYDYCIRPVEANGLGLASVLDYLNVPYEPEARQLSLL